MAALTRSILADLLDSRVRNEMAPKRRSRNIQGVMSQLKKAGSAYSTAPVSNKFWGVIGASRKSRLDTGGVEQF